MTTTEPDTVERCKNDIEAFLMTRGYKLAKLLLRNARTIDGRALDDPSIVYLTISNGIVTHDLHFVSRVFHDVDRTRRVVNRGLEAMHMALDGLRKMNLKHALETQLDLLDARIAKLEKPTGKGTSTTDLIQRLEQLERRIFRAKTPPRPGRIRYDWEGDPD